MSDTERTELRARLVALLEWTLELLDSGSEVDDNALARLQVELQRFEPQDLTRPSGVTQLDMLHRGWPYPPRTET